MKKATWIFVLVVVVFAGDRIGGEIGHRLIEISQFRYSRLYKGAVSPDLLFVGNSRGLVFYQPHIEEITGLNTFNISYNGLPVDLANVLVKDCFDRNTLPRMMVVDVTMCDRKNPTLIAGFSPYRAFSDRLSALIRSASPKSYYAGQVSHLYRYNSEIFQRALYYLNKSDEDWLLDRTISPGLIDMVKEEAPYTISTDDYLLNELADMVQAARQKGVEVRLVVNPYFPPFAQKITNLPDFIAQIEAATGLTVHNYATALADTKGFGDYQHLNKYGSIQYLDMLVKDGVIDISKEKLSLLPR
ncbi:MAG: hypothetical protein D6714_05880 [Bacteroidetes bacterium]|nr:MAG: hypothetical protein D6714_05880 [Bacteroidota bacterium]